GLVRRCVLAVENIIGADEQEPRVRLRGCVRNVDRSLRVHRCGKRLINLATINVRVCCGEHNPVRFGLLNRSLDLFRVANVRLRTPQPSDLISTPLAHEGFPEHSRGAEDEDSHRYALTGWTALTLSGSSTVPRPWTIAASRIAASTEVSLQHFSRTTFS